MNYYEYDSNDIAKSIKKAISENADPTAVKYLLNERNKKIDADTALSGYKNDNVAKSAEEYVKKYTGCDSDVKRLYEIKRETAADELALLGRQNAETYKTQAGNIRAAYADKRKNVYSAYRRGGLANEEALAAMGLGRGASNTVSSGFGETSRTVWQSAEQNALLDLYKGEAADVSALASQYAQNSYDAQKQYNSAMSKLAEEEASSLEAERDYLYKLERDRADDNRKLLEAQAEEKAQNDEMEIKKLKLAADNEQRAFENSLAQRKLEGENEKALFERAYEIFKSAGVVLNDEMAQILKIPVGTKYWEYVIDEKNASANMLRAWKK